MANSNVDISNKLFTYVKHGVDISQTIKDIYYNSLIFIGDEQQIYVPAIDTYVGVGKTKYNGLSKSILWVPSLGTYSITTKEGGNSASGKYSLSIGENTVASGKSSLSGGTDTRASGENAVSFGNYTLASGDNSFASGDHTKATGDHSFVEGSFSEANGDNSHAEGLLTYSNGINSHAEGNNTYSLGESSHSEGNSSVAYGESTHSEGKNTYSIGNYSHAEGLYTYTYNESEHAEGKYNKSNTNTIHSIGIGTGNNARKNAFEVVNNGNAYLINVGGFTGDNRDSATTLQDIINRAISSTNTGTVNNSGTHVINNVHINSYGDLSYTYHDLSGSDSSDFLTGYSQTGDGKVSVSTQVFTNAGHQKTTNQTYVITYTYIDHSGKLHYDYRDISGTDSGNFVTGYTQTADGKISISKGTFATEGHVKTTEQNYVVTYTYIDANGKIHYDYRDLSGSDSGNFVTGYTQTKDGKISISKGSFTNSFTDEGKHNLVTYSSSNPHKFISYTYIDTTGKVHQTYDTIYVDPENDFKYHDLNITQVTYQGDANFVYALTGVSTTNGNATSHTIAYQISGLPTKKYVDDQFRANDALRYCGTVTPSQAQNGTVTFTHNTVHPGHETPDYSAGAVYKVNGTGYFYGERVSAGDMVISYSDSATATSSDGWNVINQNIDLRQLTPTQVYNGGSKSSNVITNVNLTSDGTLSYTYYPLDITNKTHTFSSATEVTNTNSQDLLRNVKNKGLRVITGVSLTQNGLTTELDTSYTYLYSYQGHHSGSLEQSSGFIYKVALSSDGELSAIGRDFGTQPNEKNGNYVITNAYITTTGVLYYDYRNLETTSASGVAGSNTTITNSTKVNVLTGLTQTKDGKVSYAYTLLNTSHSTNSGSATNNGTLTTSYTNVLTGVSISSDGVLSYSYTPLNVTESGHSTSSVGLDSVNHSGATTGVVTSIYVDTANDNVLSYVTRDISGSGSGNFAISYTQDTEGHVSMSFGSFSTDKASSATTHTAYLVGVSLGTDGKLSYNYANINHTNTGTSAENTAQAKRVITNVNITTAGALTYSYYDLSVDTTSSQNKNGLSAKTINTNNDQVDILRSNSANTGIKVLTGVLLTQTGTQTKLSYEYTDIYADLSHHSGSINQSSGFVYKITLSADGALSAVGRNFANTGTKSDTTAVNSFAIDFINNVNLSSTGELSYSYGKVTFGITNEVKTVKNTSNAIYLAGITSTPNDNTISYQYYTPNTYTTNGEFYTSSAIIGTDVNVGGRVDVSDSVNAKDLYAHDSIYTEGTIESEGNLTVGGDTILVGNATINGNTILGNASSDSVTLSAKTITITNATGNTSSLAFENLSKLWGTIS